MYEAPAPPKKEIPYPWIVAGLSALSLSLMFITVTDAFEVSKKGDALAASRAEAAFQVNLLQARIDVLAAEIAALRAKQGVAASNVAHSPGDARGSISQKVASNPPARPAATFEDPAKRKLRLYDEASSAKGRNDFQAAQDSYRHIIASYPDELDACVELAKLLAINIGGVTWAEKNQRYLAKLDAEVWVKKSSSGLRYKIVEQGGASKPSASSVVKCRYEGKLFDGVIFDSTKNRNNEPAEFPLNAVIPAWTEGLQYIGIGGKILLYCPSSVAYGSEGIGPIPGDSVLIFEVELVEITK
jgi:FKBP-type peptidyl-prolyl cis-trans isomerase